jgi:hypothetical protein
MGLFLIMRYLKDKVTVFHNIVYLNFSNTTIAFLISFFYPASEFNLGTFIFCVTLSLSNTIG